MSLDMEHGLRRVAVNSGEAGALPETTPFARVSIRELIALAGAAGGVMLASSIAVLLYLS